MQQRMQAGLRSGQAEGAAGGPEPQPHATHSSSVRLPSPLADWVQWASSAPQASMANQQEEAKGTHPAHLRDGLRDGVLLRLAHRRLRERQRPAVRVHADVLQLMLNGLPAAKGDRHGRARRSEDASNTDMPAAWTTTPAAASPTLNVLFAHAVTGPDCARQPCARLAQ